MRKKIKKIKVIHSKLNKKNKTLLFGVALLIILVVVFAPKLSDLTGRDTQDFFTLNVILQDEDENFITMGYQIAGAIELFYYQPTLIYDTKLISRDIKTTFTDVPPTEYFLKISISGYKEWNGALCPVTLDKDKTLIITLKSGSGITSCTSTVNQPVEDLFDFCTAGVGTYTICRGSWQTDYDEDRASCILKVYTDQTYDVTCDGDGDARRIAHQHTCDDYSDTDLSITNIDGLGGSAGIGGIAKTVAGETTYEEYLCDDIDNPEEPRIKVIKTSDTLKLWLETIKCKDCDTAQCTGVYGGRYRYWIKTCEVALPPAACEEDELRCNNDVLEVCTDEEVWEEDTDCTDDDEVCDPATLECVECLENSDCTAPEVCDTTTNTCVAALCSDHDVDQTACEDAGCEYDTSDDTCSAVAFHLTGDPCPTGVSSGDQYDEDGVLTTTDDRYYCHTDDTLKTIEFVGDTCANNYECIDQICDVTTDTCADYDVLKSALCNVLDPPPHTTYVGQELCP